MLVKVSVFDVTSAELFKRYAVINALISKGFSFAWRDLLWTSLAEFSFCRFSTQANTFTFSRFWIFWRQFRTFFLSEVLTAITLFNRLFTTGVTVISELRFWNVFHSSSSASRCFYLFTWLWGSEKAIGCVLCWQYHWSESWKTLENAFFEISQEKTRLNEILRVFLLIFPTKSGIIWSNRG